MTLIWAILTTVGLYASYTAGTHGLPYLDAVGLVAGGYGAARLLDNLRGRNRRSTHAQISNIKWGLQHGKEG